MSNDPQESPAELIAQVMRGHVSPETAAQRLARTFDPQSDSTAAAMHPLLQWRSVQVAAEVSGKSQTLQVDCLLPIHALLVKQIQQQLSFADPVGTHPTKATVVLLQLHQTEPFPALVDRLGWPPPKSLVDRWLCDIESWKKELLRLGWPLDVGRVDELVIDHQGTVRWPWLPLRVAQSMLLRQRNLDATSPIASWVPLDVSKNSLPVLDQMMRLVAFDPVNRPSSASQTERQAASKDQASAQFTDRSGTANQSTRLDKGTRSRRKKKSAHNKRLTLSVLAATTVVISLVIFTLTRNSTESLTANTAVSPSPTNPGAAGLFVEYTANAMDAGGKSTSDEADKPLDSSLQVNELTTLDQQLDSSDNIAQDSMLEQLGIAKLSLDLTGGDVLAGDSTVGPAVDLQSDGFAPAMDTDREPSSQQELSGSPPAANDVAPANSAAPLHPLLTVSLPDRSDLLPVELPFKDSVQLDSLKLEFSGVSSWKIVRSDTADVGAADGRQSESAWIVKEDQTASEAVASLSLLSSGALPTFAWTEAAATNPTVDAIRNGRIVTPMGESVYLRDPLVFPQQNIQLSSELEIAFSAIPDSAHTTTTINVEQSLPAPLEEDAKRTSAKDSTPIYRWLSPVESAGGRKLRGLVEFQASEEAPVNVRTRIDFEIARRSNFASVSIATLNGGASWFAITEDGILEALDRMGAMKTDISQRLAATRQLYSNVSDSDRRAILRQQRDILESQEKSAIVYGERLVELQKLVATVTKNFAWYVQITTAWPDAQQTIMLTKPDANLR